MEWKHSPGQRGRLWHYIARSRLSQLILCLLVFLILTPIVAHYYLSNIGGDGSDSNIFRSRSQLDHAEDLENLKSTDLKGQIEELRRIKASVNNELRDLESKRQRLQADISKYHTQIESYRLEQEGLEKEIQHIKLNLAQLKQEQDDMASRFMPVLKAPESVLTSGSAHTLRMPPDSSRHCKLHSCFDYSRCSLLSGFPVFVYNSGNYFSTLRINDFTRTSVESALEKSGYLTPDARSACIHVVLLGEASTVVDSATLQQQLYQLPHWYGDGRNHLLLNVARSVNNFDLFSSINTGRAMIAQSSFVETFYRENFDIVIPPNLGKVDGEIWNELPPLSPVRRTYFLSFLGQFNENLLSRNSDKLWPQTKQAGNSLGQGRQLSSVGDVASLLDLEATVVQSLKDIENESRDKVYLNFICDKAGAVGIHGDWLLCGDEQRRHDLLKDSTFSIIIAPVNQSFVSTATFQTRLYESLKFGAVPVILGDFAVLPFKDILTWRKSVLTLPKSRVTELLFFLKTFTDNDVMDLRRHGRNMFESYFGTTVKIVDTLLSVVRTRLQIPPRPVSEVSCDSVFNASRPMQLYEGPELNDQEKLEETNELLGPIEPPFPSMKFSQNYSQNVHVQSFHHPGDPFHMFPNTPFINELPSEAKFLGSGYGFRPIKHGEGGSGKDFSEALGGNQPREQFTVVILTYERDTVLLSAIRRLKDLPYLNKVVVVWNNPELPSTNLRWPEIGVPVHVMKMSKNSLNNRFLPFDVIETEAILSIDDDTHLRHDEIVFGFRVWREERDRIVGFPGRFHSWDAKHNAWLYNSNYSCELSMVLTGAAFFHKYYAYLYSYSMPQAIRAKVDEYINCEDIAMNFLVSHITRRPPVKITSRWTFRCPGCPSTLTFDSSHFEERHKCINFFVEVYGYMPLLYTQYRVDSVLFKTRIPHDQQKCFKLI